MADHLKKALTFGGAVCESFPMRRAVVLAPVVAFAVASCGRFDFLPYEPPYCSGVRLSAAPYANSSEDGDGMTADTAFVICTAAQWENMARRPDDWSKQVRLEADLDFSSATAVSIGDPATPFTGTLNGAGHRISGLVLDRSGDDNVGLFARLDRGAVVRNLRLDGVDVVGHAVVGALAGQVHDAARIEDVAVQGRVRGMNRVGGVVGSVFTEQSTLVVSFVRVAADVDVTATVYQAGGIFGATESNSAARTELYEVSSSGTVTTDDTAGGLIGYGQDILINRSRSSADVVSGDIAGGLVGEGFVWNFDNRIEGSTASGKVSCSAGSCGGLVGIWDGETTTSSATGAVTCGGESCGGLIGEPSQLSSTKQSYATGAVSAVNFAGGLIGSSAGIVQDCYATGAVEGQRVIGGVVAAVNSGELTRVYSSAMVRGVDDIGGLVGLVATNSVVRDSFATGSVAGNAAGTHVSLLVGSAAATATLSNLDYAASATCANPLGSCTIVGTAQPTPAAFFTSTTPPLTSWDFTRIWSQRTDQLPVLLSAPR